MPRKPLRKHVTEKQMTYSSVVTDDQSSSETIITPLPSSPQQVKSNAKITTLATSPTKLTSQKKKSSTKHEYSSSSSSSSSLSSISASTTPTKQKTSKTKKSSNVSTTQENKENEEQTPGGFVSPSRGKSRSPGSRALASAVALDLSFGDDLSSSSSTVAVVGTPLTLSSSSLSSSPSRGFPKSKIEINSKVNKVYKMINKRTGSIGGNGTTGAIYGELTVGSMQKIINMLKEKCAMDHQSRFIDVGAGLGKPNLHVCQDPCVAVSLGIELENIRWQLSMFNLSYILNQVISGKADVNANVNFICNDIDEANSTDPFTHIYMYDLGFPPSLQQSIARKFNESVHAKYLVSYRPPHRVIQEYLYEVELIDQIPTSMHGSGEVHTAYFYKRVHIPRAMKASDNKIHIPARIDYEENEIEVVCDPLFQLAIELAIGDIQVLYEHVHTISQEYMESARPTREKKPTTKITE